MKKIIFFIAFLLLLISCSSPKNTAQEFLQALNSKQFETALSLVTEDSKPILYHLIDQQTQEMPLVDIKVKNCASPDDDDQHVICLYAISAEGETFEKKMHLIKENNDWKVDLTQDIE